MQASNDSPRSKINKFVEDVPKQRKRRRVSTEEYKILLPGEQETLSVRNYNVKQLKHMCRHYKQRVSGNKDELTKRIYNYLRLSSSAIIIQTIIRKVLLKRLINAKGPAFITRGKCVNDFDFFTMESVKDIELAQFISYQDMDGFIYGFDILSLQNLVAKSQHGINTQNPYNRKQFPGYLYENAETIVKLSTPFFGKCKIRIEAPPPIDERKVIELQLITLFQDINELGNYANHSWVWGLTRIQLIRFVRECVDIWQYRANLTNEIKRLICPPHGNPFCEIAYHSLPSLEWMKLQKAAVSLIKHLVTRAHSRDNKALGAQYVLCALTLVNEEAAMAMPWLYQSVAQT